MFNRPIFLLVLAGFTCLSGCDMKIKGAWLSNDATYLWLAAVPSRYKTIFSPSDDKVTLTVEFENNFVGTYQSFYVKWIQPDGDVFLEEKVQTKWGSNNHIIVSLSIRDNKPTELPGEWRVELYQDGKQMLQRKFQIREQ